MFYDFCLSFLVYGQNYKHEMIELATTTHSYIISSIELMDQVTYSNNKAKTFNLKNLKT